MSRLVAFAAIQGGYKVVSQVELGGSIHEDPRLDDGGPAVGNAGPSGLLTGTERGDLHLGVTVQPADELSPRVAGGSSDSYSHLNNFSHYGKIFNLLRGPDSDCRMTG